MREPISRRLRLHVALVGALVVTMALGATTVRAAEDDDDEAFDTKIFRGVMRELGLQRDSGEIEYRERSPLVVPPSRTLPPPRSENQAINNPAWPKDPDVAKRRQEATVTPSQKARLRGDRVEDALRPLPPDEIAAGRTTARPETGTPAGGGEDGLRAMTPEQLGYKKNMWDSVFSGFGPQKVETAPFQGEAPRTALTAPPAGYQTPSGAQPYGITPPKSTYKPATSAEDLQPAAPK